MDKKEGKNVECLLKLFKKNIPLILSSLQSQFKIEPDWPMCLNYAHTLSTPVHHYIYIITIQCHYV